MPLSIQTVLAEAKDHISDYRRWMKGYDHRTMFYGMDSAGNYVDHADSSAVRWGILGSIMYVLEVHYGILYSDDDLWFDIVKVLRKTARPYGYGCSASFNDSPSTTHREVMEFFDKAISNV